MLDGKAIKSTYAIKTIEKMANIVTAYTDEGSTLLQKTVENKTNETPVTNYLEKSAITIAISKKCGIIISVKNT